MDSEKSWQWSKQYTPEEQYTVQVTEFHRHDKTERELEGTS